MQDLTKKISDKLVIMEEYGSSRSWKSPFKTEISATDEFGDTLFTLEHNMVVIGGALTVLEKMWNVRSPLVIKTIGSTEIMGINAAYDTTSTTEIVPQDNYVCLWGIGVGGASDAFGSVHDVKFYEREIGQNHQSLTQMIPFRVIHSNEPEGADVNKYFLRKDMGNGYTAFYGKVFETTPFIRSLWRDGAEGEDGSEVTDGVHDTSRTDDIECFVEMHLKIEKTDVREYFETIMEGIEAPRINTIGLFTARKVLISATDTEGQDASYYDYADVKLFSKFNFDNEALSNKKEINFTYRVYVS